MSPPNGRIAWAAVVDYLLFAALWGLVVWPLGAAMPWLAGTGARLGAFAAAWLLGVRLFGATPGSRALGMRRVDGEWLLEHAPAAGERWWTLLAGVLLVSEGASNLVRFADGMPPPPLFGVELAPVPAYLLVAVAGGANVAAGLLVLRSRPVGALLGIGIGLVEAASLLTAPAAVREWIEALVIARRASEGLPVREGEVAFLQAALPAFVLSTAAGASLWLLLVARRLRTDDRNTGAPHA